MQLHNVSDWNLLRPTDSTDSHSCSRPKYPRRNWPKEGSDHHSTPTRLLQLLMHPPPPNPLPWSLSEEVEEPLEGVNLFLAVAGVRLGKRGVRAAESWWESLQHYPWARPTLSCLVLPSALVCASVFCLATTMTVGNMESATLFDAGKKGRGLKAAKELVPGEVIFAEPSFSAVVFDK